MICSRFLIPGLACTSLLSCASSGETRALMPVSDLYCDNFLIYEICAQDMNRDGIVELVYFSDTNEVFLYREGTESQVPDALTMHNCVQMMDDDIVNNASQLFYISDQTPYIERLDIKGALMFSYMGYMPRVSRCTGEAGGSEPVQPAGDEFDFEIEAF